MLNSSKKLAGKVFGGALLAGAVLGFGASNADAGFLFDLRVMGGGDAKTAKVAKAGDVVSLGIYAVVTGADADLTNEGFSAGFVSVFGEAAAGSFKINGNLGDVVVDSKFTENGYQAGKVQDMNGDGFMDVGGADTNATKSDWIFPRNQAGVAGTEILVATLKYTVAGIVGNDTTVGATINLGTREKSALVAAASWKEDGKSKAPVNGTKPAVGAPVSITVDIPDPTGGKLAYGSAAEGNTVATLKVKAANRGYLSEVTSCGDAAAGNVKLEITGTGPADEGVYVMMWLNGTEEQIAAAKADLDEVTFLGQDDPSYQDIVPGYTERAGAAPTWLAKFPASMADGSFINFDFGDSGATLGKIAVVPEPASLTLLGLGALGLMARRRRA